MAEQMVPIITTTLGIDSKLAGKIVTGLVSGTYQRVGGVIRTADGKRVVAWLRDMAGSQTENLGILSTLGPLLQLNVALSVLSLSISTASFVMVMKRLDLIEERLEAISKNLVLINRKFDLSFYANFRAALELARTAFGMRDDTNRRISATQAINRFLEAEQHYLGMLDSEIKSGSPAVTYFLNTLFLAYISTARCYLELNETETARKHLQEGSTELVSRVKLFYSSIIDVNPAIFLHPNLAGSISLERLTCLLRHYEPSLDTNAAFEGLREMLWTTASQYPENWLRKLPISIWNHTVDGREKQTIGNRARNSDELLKQLLPRLPEAFAQVEMAQECLGCIDGYGIELQYLLDHDISFHMWQQIKLPNAGNDDPIAVLLPEESELVK